MVAILILSLALLSGAASAFQLEDVVIASNGTSNSTLTLQRFPSIVQVEFHNIWGWWMWQQGCAASVLNSRFVLTSASCFSGASYAGAHSRRIRAGANFRNTGGAIVYVEREINYPQNITNGTLLHDISVVRLVSSLLFGTLIQQAPILQQGSVIPNGLILNQVGWGQNSDNQITLSSAFVTTISIASNQTLPSNATSNIIAAQPSSSAWYNGDVGGPWIWGTVTVGVIPARNVLNGTGLVATSISAYTNWIISVAR